MAETINNIIGKEAFDQIQELLLKLRELDDQMVEAINRAEKYRTAFQNAGGFKEAATGLGNLQKSVVELNKTTSERLNIEREIKVEGEKAAKVVMGEVDAFKKLQRTLEESRIPFENLSNEIVNQQYKLDKNKESQKALKNAIKELDAEFKAGKISKDEYYSKWDEYSDRLSTMVHQETGLKIAIGELKITLKGLLKEQQSSMGSMDKMNAQLGYLRDAYRQLSQEERDNVEVGGALKQAINQLDEALKMHDKSIGNNQRSVGNYEIANKDLRTVLREVRQDLALQKIEYNNTERAIIDQEKLVASLARTKGTESAEYKESIKRLNELKQAYQTAGETITDLEKKGGELYGIMNKTNLSMKSFGDSAATSKAIGEGVGLMINSYTLFQSSMVALGVKSEGLVEVFGKLMIMQQGLNAVTQITNSLQKESILRLKLKSVWEKVSLSFTQQRTAAKVQETASTVASTVADNAQNIELGKQAAATTAATATTAGLATAEGVATKTSWTLVGSLKAVGSAIKSIPVIGWIVAAIAALGTLTALVYKHLTAEKELTQEQRARKYVADQLHEVQTKTTEQTKETSTKMLLLVKELDRVNVGSKEWEKIVTAISKETGLNLDNIKNSKDEIKRVTEEWINQYKLRTKAEMTLKQVVQSELDYTKLRNEILSASSKDRKDLIERLNLSKAAKNGLLEQLNIVKGTKEGTDKNTEAWKNVLIYLDLAEKNLSGYNNSLLETLNIQDLISESSSSNASTTSINNLLTLIDIEKKRAEIMEDGIEREKELSRLRILQIEKERKERLTAAKETGEDVKLINEFYDIEIDKESKERNKKIKAIETAKAESIKKINNDLFNALLNLEKYRLSGSSVSSQEVTDKLIELEQKRSEEIISIQETAKIKELEGLEEGSDQYLAIVKKYEALIQLEVEKSENKQRDIRRAGWDGILKDLEESHRDRINKEILSTGKPLSNYESMIAEADLIKEQINALDDLGTGFEKGSQDYEDYVKKREELGLELIDVVTNIDDVEKQVFKNRIGETQNLISAYSSLSGAISNNIDDEKKRIIVQQRIAMAEIATVKGLAIAEVLLDKKGDPYTKAVRIAANLAMITAGFIQASTAIKQAKAYETGTDYHTGGYAVVGEGLQEGKYKPEVVMAGGKQYVFDQPTFIKDLPIGSQVKPLEDWINSSSLESPIDRVSAIKMIELLSDIKNKPTVNIEVGKNIYSHIMAGSNRSRILNSRFRA